MFYGLGADGTVGANKNSIKIIGTETDNFAQGYFVYDSKKSGSMTISHLRFGPREIHSTYLIREANFIGCHQFFFLEKYNVLEAAVKGATFLLNSPYPLEETWDKIPKKVQQEILATNMKFMVVLNSWWKCFPTQLEGELQHLLVTDLSGNHIFRLFHGNQNP